MKLIYAKMFNHLLAELMENVHTEAIKMISSSLFCIIANNT